MERHFGIVLKIIPFQSVFVDIKDLPKTEEEQEQKKTFLKNPNLMEELDHLAGGLLWFLVYTYRNRLQNGGIINEPEAVRIATKNYKTRNNVWHAFISEKIDESKRGCELKESTGYKISIKDLWYTFKEWFKASYPNVKTMSYNKMDIKDYFSKRWGDPIDNHSWNGIKIKELGGNN